MPPQWYVARTRPHTDYNAACGLERAGFQVFAPRIRTVDAWLRHLDVPLFPGYLFLRHNLEENGWPSLRRVPQVVGLVQFGGVAPPVPDEVVAGLAQRVKDVNSKGGHWNCYKPGERVHVRLGTQDVLAEVVTESKSPQARVRVLMEIMGRQVNAEVPWRYIWPTSNGDFDRERRNVGAPRRTRGRGRWINGFGPRAEASRSQQDNGYSSS